MTLNIAIAGAGGRMGRMLISAVAESELCMLSGALEYDGSPLVGQDAGLLVGNDTSGILVSAERADAFSGADVIIDFTLPAATLENMHDMYALEGEAPAVPTF